MDKKTLVEKDIVVGRQLVRDLEEAGLPIASAMWLRRPEDESWHLYLSTPDVEVHGPLAVYAFIDSVIRRNKIPGIAIDHIDAANTTNHFVNSISRALKVTNSTVEIKNSTFNNVRVDDAVVYKITRSARASKDRPKPTFGAKKRSKERV
jgi:hypothetical protein